MTRRSQLFLALGLAVATALPISAAASNYACAATAEDLDRDSDQALQKLYKADPVAQEISKHARAILVTSPH